MNPHDQWKIDLEDLMQRPQLLDMCPSFSLANHADRACGNSIGFADDCSGKGGLSDLSNFGLGKLRRRGGLSFSHSAMTVLIRSVISLALPSQIRDVIVRPITILMAGMEALWAWAVKSLASKGRDRLPHTHSSPCLELNGAVAFTYAAHHEGVAPDREHSAVRGNLIEIFPAGNMLPNLWVLWDCFISHFASPVRVVVRVGQRLTAVPTRYC